MSSARAPASLTKAMAIGTFAISGGIAEVTSGTARPKLLETVLAGRGGAAFLVGAHCERPDPEIVVAYLNKQKRT